MGQTSGFIQWPKRHFQRWITARTPRLSTLQFSQKKIYIVPSKAGLGLLVVFFTTLLMGINFQNNLVFVVAFWLLALLTVNILFTYRNLSGLQIKVVHAEPCFAGEKALFWFELTESQGRERLSIYVGWDPQDGFVVNLKPGETQRLCLSYDAPQRGWLVPNRLVLITRYPTGLARAWGYFLPDTAAIVYPRPQPLPEASVPTSTDGMHSKGKEIRGGTYDFSGIRDYRSGDSLKQIHWPQYAKTGQLASREFVDYEPEAQWLRWDEWPGQQGEQLLSHFTARVLAFHQDSTPWGLELPSRKLSLDLSEAHRLQSLTALALHGKDKP